MPFRLDEAIDLLSRTPETLRAWLAGLPDDVLTQDEGAETFSPKDVLAHLVHGEEEDWMPRARILLEHGEARPFESFDPAGFRDRYPDRSAAELLDRFEVLRDQNVTALRSMRLSADELAATGTHPEFGRVKLEEMLATWTVHDLAHMAQIARVVAKRYRDDVGPWRAYLGILDR